MKTLVFGAIAVVTGFLVFRMVRFGGFMGALFGARVESTIGRVRSRGTKSPSMSVTVHRLGGSSERTVGLQVTSTSLLSYEVVVVPLSMTEAKDLVEMLQAAIDER